MHGEMKCRTFDGSHNNLAHPDWGAAGSHLRRRGEAAYADGRSALAVRGANNPNPRDISNKLARITDTRPNAHRLSDVVWAWGQFIDHELDLTEPDAEEESFYTPDDDPILPGAKVEFHRSLFDEQTGQNSPREQINQISAYMDATNVYGASPTRAAALRRFDGTGRLRTSDGPDGDLPPYNVAGLSNAGSGRLDARRMFVAGDVRANEHAVLTAMHTLFVREHNRLCADIMARRGVLAGNDEAIYQLARKIVGGLMQVITYEEFLPALLGPNALSPYTGYKDDVDASIWNTFSTAAYRLGHSMLSGTLPINNGPNQNGPNQNGKAGRTMQLRTAFFNPKLVEVNGIAPFLGGLPHQVMQEIDVNIVEDVRSFLFGPPNPEERTLLDLAALNIQRGRDHGLPDYNQCRADFGLPKVHKFSDITTDKFVAKTLLDLYGDVDSVDPWIGGLAEDHLPDSSVGPFIWAVLVDQFQRLRDGDRFWYEYDPHLPDEWKREIADTRLVDVIRRNTHLTDIPDTVFVVA